ncbi:MAG: NADP-dependent glyceraldehyde-3-phosphate dehydrogenase [Bacteroidales bacterium]|nr:NADP-dependent glyceraldehyde-3-phosphate dehydrogenase [Bacteroidales bacterium]
MILDKEIFPKKEEIVEHLHLQVPVNQDYYLTNGQLKKWNGPFEEVYSPIFHQEEGNLKQTLLGYYPLLTENESLEALDAALVAYDSGKGLWPTMSISDRITHVENFIAEMITKRDEVVELLQWEIGKNLVDSLKEFDRTVEYIKDTIDALKELDRQSSRFVIEQGILGQIRRSPFGVVLCMGPFNYPLNETFTTLIPALIMGNTVIFKPPKLGVLLHKPLLESFKNCFPAGVVNTVYGDGQKVIGPIMKSGKLNVLAFIGSSRVADILKLQHPKPHRMRSILGLEAKNAGIILPNVELESAVNECVTGTLSFNGQRCTALKILFVHQAVADIFIAKFCEKIDQLKAGMPWESGIHITPLPEPNKTEYLNGLIEDAKNKGAKIMNQNGGDFIESLMIPAVLFPVDSSMKVYHEEQFGPVIPIVPFTDLSEPMKYITESDYGQQVSIFGSDSDDIAALIDPLVNQVCRVNVNSQCQRGPDSFPFTGRKDSAEGTLSVSDALKVFSIRTLVAARLTDDNKKIINDIVNNRKSSFLSTDYIL